MSVIIIDALLISRVKSPDEPAGNKVLLAHSVITDEGLGIIRCSLNGSSPGIFQFWITTSFLALIDSGRKSDD